MSWGTAGALDLAGSVVVDRILARGDVEAKASPVLPELPGLKPQIVCPGDAVAAEPGALRGRGIVEREDGKLVATTVGVVEQVNKLLYVRPLNYRYVGSTGDVVVGRIGDVMPERWSVEIGAGLSASLALGAIQLPGNVQRRRTDEDTLRMREFFEINDVIAAEVQKVHESGELSLQTRNARYGKLQNGVLVSVPSVYVRRQAQHIVTLPQIGVMVILGNNGMIWICAPPKVAGSGRQETLNFSQMDVRYEKVHSDFRERICRVRNSVLALASRGFELTPESITLVYEQSVKRGLAAWELIDAARCDAAGLVQAVVDEMMAVAASSAGQLG
jgi:exosome complex component RRP4